MSRPSRKGLLWEEGGLGPKPRWEYEPRLEAVKAVCLRALELQSEDCTVEFFASGSFNKLYLVIPSSQQKLLMRVSLPVDPRNKTMGEVATIQWLRHFTGIPVPDIIAYDASCDNEIGFEWILMPFIPGASLYSLWRKLPMTAKEALVKQLADFQAQILRASDKSPLRGIGTLTYASAENGSVAADSTPEPGQIVSRHFFAGDHFNYDIPRGPFPSSSDFLESYINIIIQDLKTELEATEDEEDKEEIEVQLGIAERLMRLLPTVFPPAKDIPEHTAPWHDDLSLQNILVDDDGTVTAALDWEFVSAMPRWLATEMPQFLVGPERAEEPVRDDYVDETEEEAEEYRKSVDDGDHAQGNEGKNELYWFHKMEYEQTRLREVYTERMRELRPTWDTEVADGVLKDDFLGAVERCAAGFPLRAIGRWIDAVEKGESPRLNDVLQPKA